MSIFPDAGTVPLVTREWDVEEAFGFSVIILPKRSTEKHV
jgi:hypothetical protein